jgi:uncharacterized protein
VHSSIFDQDDLCSSIDWGSLAENPSPLDTMTLQRLDQDLDDEELQELGRFLASPGLVETSMDLYQVDGFFAAILSGPRTLMPSEWARWIWDSKHGEVAPEFEDLAEAQRILGLLMRHYNTVARALMDGAENFVPIYPQGNAAAASSWCAGYLAGLRFDREEWATLLFGKPKWFAPILSLGTANDESPTTDLRQVARWMREVAPSVAKIHAFWLAKRRAHALRVTTGRIPRAAGRLRPGLPRTGRNDPCPCGSGKKFKRCCGTQPTPPS